MYRRLIRDEIVGMIVDVVIFFQRDIPLKCGNGD